MSISCTDPECPRQCLATAPLKPPAQTDMDAVRRRLLPQARIGFMGATPAGSPSLIRAA